MAGYTNNGNGTYAVNYDDDRFKQVNAEKEAELANVTNKYDDMINQSDSFYNKQIEAAQEWAKTQTENQQAQTDFAIEKQNQAKEQLEQDYIKEQKGAYTDWQKQSNQYGVNAENMAAQGLTGSGYSESSQVSMWNTYQNRLASARQSYEQSKLNYDNNIKEAILTNNEQLATIAYNALQQQLQLGLEGFQYKNTLIETQLTQQQNVKDTYYNRYQDVLSQINGEISNQMAADEYAREQARWEAEQAEATRQWEEEMAFQKEQYEYQKAQDAKSSSSSSYSGSSYTSNNTIDDDGGNNTTTLSTNGEKIYSLLTSSAANKIKGLNTPAVKREYIYKQNSAGVISDSDAQLLFARLGLN